MAELRCFLAIDLNDKLKRKLNGVVKELELPGVRPVAVDSLHITLKFFGNIKPADIEKVIMKLDLLKFNKFKVKLVGFGGFPNKNYVRVVWVGCESPELKLLVDRINKSLKGIFTEEKIEPHLTLARVQTRTDLRSLFQKYDKLGFGGFEVSRFQLKSSELTKTGPKYKDIRVFSSNSE